MKKNISIKYKKQIMGLTRAIREIEAFRALKRVSPQVKFLKRMLGNTLKAAK